MLRTSTISRLALLAGAAVALPSLFACLSHPVKVVEYDKAQEAKKGVSIAISKDVDIVFVIDDSGSMAEEQALLSANFASFIGVLEAEDVKANYRLAITTTDAGNPLTVHGPSIYAEMEAMEAAGIPPAEVLVLTTRGGAHALGRDDLGTLAPGQLADLVVLEDDPGASASAFRSITHVMKGGALHEVGHLAAE